MSVGGFFFNVLSTIKCSFLPRSTSADDSCSTLCLEAIGVFIFKMFDKQEAKKVLRNGDCRTIGILDYDLTSCL